jgi:hypothetical protein
MYAAISMPNQSHQMFFRKFDLVGVHITTQIGFSEHLFDFWLDIAVRFSGMFAACSLQTTLRSAEDSVRICRILKHYPTSSELSDCL